MATSQKISNLNEVSSPNIEDVFPIVNNGETKKVTLDVVIQQASITMASYINNLLLAYAPTAYVNSLVAVTSAANVNYVNTSIDSLSSLIDSEYAKISFVGANYLPATDRAQIIIDAVIQGYNDFIPLTDRNTIIEIASAAGFNAGSDYSDNTFIPLISIETIIDTASSLAVNYADDTFIPLISTDTIIDTASSLAVEYSDNTFIPLISTETIIYTASSLAAVYADTLLGGIGGAGFINATDIPIIVHSASSLAVNYADNTFIPLTSTETIIDTASSLAYVNSNLYTHDYFVPLSSVDTIVDTASSLAYAESVFYADNTFIPLISTDTIIDTASSLAVNYADNTFIPLISTDTIVDTASSLAVDYSDSTFIPLLSTNTIIDTASALAVSYSHSFFIPLSDTNTIIDTASSLAVQDISSVKTVVQTFSTAWLTPQKEFNYQLSAGTVDTYLSYSGTALYGSSYSDSVWTIKRIIYNEKGGVANVGKAVNVKWDDRDTSVIYL